MGPYGAGVGAGAPAYWAGVGEGVRAGRAGPGVPGVADGPSGRSGWRSWSGRSARRRRRWPGAYGSTRRCCGCGWRWRRRSPRTGTRGGAGGAGGVRGSARACLLQGDAGGRRAAPGLPGPAVTGPLAPLWDPVPPGPQNLDFCALVSPEPQLAYASGSLPPDTQAMGPPDPLDSWSPGPSVPLCHGPPGLLGPLATRAPQTPTQEAPAPQEGSAHGAAQSHQPLRSSIRAGVLAPARAEAPQ